MLTNMNELMRSYKHSFPHNISQDRSTSKLLVWGRKLLTDSPRLMSSADETVACHRVGLRTLEILFLTINPDYSQHKGYY